MQYRVTHTTGNKQTNTQTNTQTNKQINKQTNKQTNTQTNKQTNKQPNKQTNKQSHGVGVGGDWREEKERNNQLKVITLTLQKPATRITTTKIPKTTNQPTTQTNTQNEELNNKHTI